MAKRKPSPLNAFAKAIKDEKKAERSPAATLKHLIDTYCLSGEFDAYLYQHRYKLPEYIDDQQRKRHTKHRASQVGKCLQQQAFNLAGAPQKRIRAVRPARQFRALYNGTFVHLRFHLMFDALAEKGLVTTLYAEHLAFNEELSLSGTTDRVVEFNYLSSLYRAVLDFKSIKSHDFDNLIKPQLDHSRQQHAYDLTSNYKADGWIMLYENKDTNDIKAFDAPYDEITKRRIVRDLKDIETYALQFQLEVPMTERINLDLNVKWCRYCPFEELCLLQHPDLREQQAKIGDDDDTEPVF